MKVIGLLFVIFGGFFAWRAVQLSNTYQGLLAVVPFIFFGSMAILGLYLLFQKSKSEKKAALKMARPQQRR